MDPYYNDKLIYLATPYSKWEDGIHNAYVEAAKLTARLLKVGYKVYSPIAHTHPLAIYGNIDPYDHKIWLPFDTTMLEKADVLLVAEMTGWQESKGVAYEMEFFADRCKDIRFVDPKTLEVK